MEQEENVVDENFPLFFKAPKNPKPPQNPKSTTAAQPNLDLSDVEPHIEKSTDVNPSSSSTLPTSFAELGLSEWAVQTCKELGMPKPTAVQAHCVPKILAGRDVLGLAQTGSGKTAAFALPILHRLAENPFGVFALVVTPTRELAFQMAEQFRALGSCLHLRCSVIVGGMDMLEQAKSLMARPHVVIATPGRLKVFLEGNPDIPSVFSKTKVLNFYFFPSVLNFFILNP